MLSIDVYILCIYVLYCTVQQHWQIWMKFWSTTSSPSRHALAIRFPRLPKEKASIFKASGIDIVILESALSEKWFP